MAFQTHVEITEKQTLAHNDNDNNMDVKMEKLERNKSTGAALVETDEYEQDLKQNSKDIGVKYYYRTKHLNEDIYNAAIMLTVRNKFRELPMQDRSTVIWFVFVCAVTQIFALIALLYNSRKTFTNSRNLNDNNDIRGGFEDISLKIICIILLSAYLLQAIEDIASFPILLFKVSEFKKITYYIIIVIKYMSLFLAGFLSIAIIVGEKTGFDAIVNALSITFILEMDDWLFCAVKNYPEMDNLLTLILKIDIDPKEKENKEKSISFISIAIRYSYACTDFLQFRYLFEKNKKLHTHFADIGVYFNINLMVLFTISSYLFANIYKIPALHICIIFFIASLAIFWCICGLLGFIKLIKENKISFKLLVCLIIWISIGIVPLIFIGPYLENELK